MTEQSARVREKSGKSTRNGWPLIICLGLGLAVWIAFGESTRHEFVNFDDDVYVYENENVARGLTWENIGRAFTQTHAGNWHPLTTLSHLIDCQLFGLHPHGPHFVNVLIHSLASILLFLVLRRMTSTLWESAFVAAVFAIHPLRVESVAWVAERKDVLSGLFFVLTIAAYIRYVRHPFNALNYSLLVGAYSFGLLCKPMLVTVPFVLLLMDYWPLRRWPNGTGEKFAIWKRLFGEKAPLFLLSGLACAVTLLAQKQAIHLAEPWSFSIRAGNAVVAYAVYLRQVFFPANLAVLYPHPGDQLAASAILAAILLFLLVSAAAVCCRRNHPYLLVGWLWYLGMLLPVIGLIQVGMQARADRYTYLPHIGISIMVAWGAARLRHLLPFRGLFPATAAVLVLGLLLAARAQTKHWRNSVSLWTQAVANTASNPVAHVRLGSALAQHGRLIEAIPEYEEAIKLKPGFLEAQVNLGTALYLLGRYADSLAVCKSTLAEHPDSPVAHYNMGTVLVTQKDLDGAAEHLLKAVALKPNYPEAHVNLGNVLARLGREKEATEHFAIAVRLKPDVVEYRISLGNALGRAKEFPEAMAQFEQALRISAKSAEARLGIGSILIEQGDPKQALTHLQKALALATQQAKPDLERLIREQIDRCR